MKITPDRVAALVVTLAPLVYFWPATLGRVFLCPDDGLIFNVPVRVAAARIVWAGHLPLWNPYLFGGMPLFAAAQGGVLFPLNWFFLLFDPPAATNLMMLTTYAVAGLGAYLYARRSGASVAGAALTGFVWQSSGFMIAQIGHTNVVQTAALAGWLLWAIDGYGETGERRRGALVAMLVALQIFAGHQQTNAYALLLAVAYALVMAWVSATREARRAYLKSLALIAAGAMLAAVQILPTLELLRRSLRSEASYDFFTSFSLPPRFVLTFLAPYLFGGGDGNLFRALYTGPDFYGEYIAYVGLAPLALAALAPLVRSDVRTKFWAAAALAGLALAIGRFWPFDLYAIVYRVPLLNLFRVPARHLWEVDFALAVLAGRAVTSLAAARDRRRTLMLAAVAGACLVALTCLAVTAWRPDDFRLGRQGPVSLLRAPELFMPPVVAILSAWALWNYTRGRRRGALLVLFAVIAFDLSLWGHASGWRRGPGLGSELWREPSVVHALRERARDAGPYRVLTVPRSIEPDASRPEPAPKGEFIFALQPNTYMMHGVENAAGYDGFGLERYSRLADDMKIWGELAEPEKTLFSEGRALDILNVRYLLARNPRSVPDTHEAGGGTHSSPAEASRLTPTPAPTPATQVLGGYAFAEETLGASPLGGSERLVFNAPGIAANRFALVTSLAWAADVADGEEVARVRMFDENGRAFEFALRAGEHTSEWSHERADTRARTRHRLAPVATSFAVSDAATGDFEGHTYVASFALPMRATITGGEIETLKFASAPKLSLNVERLSLLDGAGATPLRRGQVRKTSARAGERAGGAESPSVRWRHVADEGRVAIYENTLSLPRAWLAGEALALDDDAALRTIRTGLRPDGRAWDPRATALVGSAPGTNPLTAGDAGSATVTRYEPNRVDVSVEAEAECVLVLAENHYPGWHAYLDGRVVETMRVNYNQRGVLVPPGAHAVSFVYRPKSVVLGMLISILACAALVAWCVWGGKLDRRRRRDAVV